MFRHHIVVNASGIEELIQVTRFGGVKGYRMQDVKEEAVE